MPRRRGRGPIVTNPYERKGGISNRQALRAGAIRSCERIVEADPVEDLSAGLKIILEDGGGSRRGSERNGNCSAGRGSDRLDGLGGDDILWGDRHQTDAGLGATDVLVGGSGRDTIYGGLRDRGDRPCGL